MGVIIKKMSLLSENKSSLVACSVAYSTSLVSLEPTTTDHHFSADTLSESFKVGTAVVEITPDKKSVINTSVACPSGPLNIAGALTLVDYAEQGTVVLVIPDSVNTTYPHVLRFQNGLLESYNEFDLDFQVYTTPWYGTSFTLPLVTPITSPGGTGDYDFYVYWGDGASNHVTNTYSFSDITHTYSSMDNFNIKIIGKLKGWCFNTTLGKTSNNNYKITNINGWHDGFQMGTTEGGYFYQCYSLNILASRAPNLQGVVNMNYAFFNCELTFATNINTWDVSNVTSMYAMFQYCYTFNHYIGDWDVSNVIDMSSMFNFCYSLNQSFNNWNVSKVQAFDSTFYYCYEFNQPLNKWNVSGCYNMDYLFNSSYKFNQNINNWDTSNVLSMYGTFSDAYLFNQPLNDWNTGHVKDMRYMLTYSAFNRPLYKWNTRNVTDFSETFYYCNAFDQNLNSWNMESATDVSYMFEGCYEYNQPMNKWNTKNCTSFVEFLYDAYLFNSPVNGMNTSLGEDFQYMFYETNFNLPVDQFDMSNSLHLGAMFGYSRFNQPVNNWNTSNVQYMWSVFEECADFNQPLDNWDLSNVVDLDYIFYNCVSFNQPLNTWNVSNVTSMVLVFYNCTAFNQPLNNWDVSNVEYFSYMFYNAVSFKQNLSAWKPLSAKRRTYWWEYESFEYMFYGVDLNSPNSEVNQDNYNALLTAWGSPPLATSLANNLVLTATFSKYTASSAASAARDYLTGTKGWSITDGGAAM